MFAMIASNEIEMEIQFTKFVYCIWYKASQYETSRPPSLFT